MSSSPVVSPEADVQSSATNAKAAAKPKIAKPKRGFYTPPPTQARVIDGHLNGKSDRKIADEVGIDRGTVRRILSQEEVISMTAELKSRALSMNFQALDVYQEILDCKYLELKGGIATKLLQGSGVLDKRGMQGTIDDAKARHLRSTEEDVKCALGPGPFPWPAKLVPRPESKKRPARKPPKPETADKPLNDQFSEDHGSSST